ncbi:YacH protein [Acididesulfobacillus acetoxydans]|uniref:UvrB/UvrC protein n=1 Tax=Acididesulfobacillus acetoxydans TaxID=1561005 RepID=A0A8S0WW49_9FIRM|nr:UvrB/UvrC motif-containing protein [Acididesulfobacillus acetoxydans]CAA7600041.1 YacH protein [Acididesulfobacillus acetoxydans]CEJ07816.1 UvrB/UvrC protein [Acididesulfobacillus acetoxydans]
MLCQNCHEREANVHIAKTVNGQTQNLYLCEQCAKKVQGANFMFQPGLIVPDFLQALFGFSPESAPQQEQACPRCGMTFSQITRAGKLGCSVCYEAFGPQIESLVRRIHGGGQHVGKIPGRKGAALKGKVELKRLKDELQALVRQEKFEEAAITRDRIRQLEQGAGG